MTSLSDGSTHAGRKPRARMLAVALFFALVLGSVGTAWAAPAGPEALPVSVVSVKSDDALDQAEALTQALRKAVRNALGWSLSQSSQSLEFLAVKLNCAEPIDAACEVQIADVLKADRFMYAVIRFADKSEKTVVGTVGFFVRGQGTKRYPLNYSANLTDPNDDALVTVAADAFAGVTGGPPKGSVKISAGGVEGQLFVDDKPMGALSAAGGTFPLTVGEHRIVVKAQGYLDAETSVKVLPLSAVETTLTMVEVEDDGPGIQVDGQLVAGIGLAVVGVAGIGVGAWGGTRVLGLEDGENSQYELFRTHSSQIGAPDVCAGGRVGAANNDIATANKDKMPSEQEPTFDVDKISTVCSDGTTGEIAQFVGYIGGGAFLLGGAILMLTSDTLQGGGGDPEADAGPSALQVVPIVTPGYQGALLTYSF